LIIKAKTQGVKPKPSFGSLNLLSLNDKESIQASIGKSLYFVLGLKPWGL